MKKKILSAIKYLLFLGIGTGLVWWQLSGMNEEERTQFIASLRHANFIWVIPIVILGLFSHFFRALRWKLLIDPIKPVSKRNAFYATMVGYFGNTFVPRAGEILRCSMLARREEMAFTTLLGTVIAERAFDLLSFLFFIVLTIVVQLDVVGNFVSESTHQIASDESGMPLWLKVVIFLVIFAIIALIRFLFKRYPEKKFVVKVRRVLSDLRAGLATIIHLRKKGRFLIYTALIWLMYLSQVYLGFQTMEVTEHLGAGAAMSVLTLSTLAMIISPGGLGAFPVAVQQVLLVYHVDNISFGWLVWGANTGIILVFGGISFILLLTKKTSQHEESRQDTGKNTHPAGT